MREGDHVEPPIVHDEGKEPVVSGDGDAPADDELSSGRSSSTSHLLRKNARGNKKAKSRRKH